MRTLFTLLVSVSVLTFVFAAQATAHAPSGAIFTTLSDGTEVNLNQFPSKEAVYLDGGPGPGAPQNAAGLDDGTYVFMVTDPSGDEILSTDLARCRQLTVDNGVIDGVVDNDCEHATGFDTDHSAVTVQLFPFRDTPNPGGVYKVWVTPVADFECSLNQVTCDAAGAKHGFNPGHTKTDNFKVQGDSVREIDVLFFKDTNGDGHRQTGEAAIPHLKIFWTDTLGVKNVRYADPEFLWGLYAHVEVPETDNGGIHTITINSQRGCKVGQVHLNDFDVNLDAQGNLAVHVGGNYDYLIEVACRQGR